MKHTFTNWLPKHLMLLTAVMMFGIVIVGCSQDEIGFTQATPVPYTGPDDGGQNQNGSGRDWTETKQMNYQGLFHVQTLFVLDNSGSMREELADYVSSRMQDFMGDLAATSGVSFQIGITDTNYNLRQGQLIQALSGQTILTQVSPMSYFAEIFNLFRASENTTQSSNERGLASAAAAVYRERMTLFNSISTGAALSRRVVVISDANDTDTTPVGNYTQVMKDIPGLQLYPIIAIPGRPCTNPVHESFGDRYVEAVAQVGGAVSSICQNDFAASLDNVFSWIQNVCIKLDDPVQNRDMIEMWVDGVKSDSFTLDASRTQVCLAASNQPMMLKVDAHHVNE